MDFIRTLLEQHPLMALFLIIALGYVVGEINVERLFPWYRGRPFRRLGHGVVRAEGGTGGHGSGTLALRSSSTR